MTCSLPVLSAHEQAPMLCSLPVLSADEQSSRALQFICTVHMSKPLMPCSFPALSEYSFASNINQPTKAPLETAVGGGEAVTYQCQYNTWG